MYNDTQGTPRQSSKALVTIKYPAIKYRPRKASLLMLKSPKQRHHMVYMYVCFKPPILLDEE